MRTSGIYRCACPLSAAYTLLRNGPTSNADAIPSKMYVSLNILQIYYVHIIHQTISRLIKTRPRRANRWNVCAMQGHSSDKCHPTFPWASDCWLLRTRRHGGWNYPKGCIATKESKDHRSLGSLTFVQGPHPNGEFLVSNHNII